MSWTPATAEGTCARRAGDRVSPGRVDVYVGPKRRELEIDSIERLRADDSGVVARSSERRWAPYRVSH